jgi:uncharacterized small protein (DUF1192 family)
MAGISWEGHNLLGDRKSIEEVQRLLRLEARFAALQDELYRTQIRLAARSGEGHC